MDECCYFKKRVAMVGIHKHKTTSSLGRNGNEKVMRGKCRGVRNKRPVAACLSIGVDDVGSRLGPPSKKTVFTGKSVYILY
jgi:hypothetical protein